MAFFRSDGWVKSALGAAVPGAQIYICAPQPANVDFLPPTPLATIYSDPNGLVPITQPILTDGFGHYDFYTVPGIYTIVVVNAGQVQQVYPDQSVGNVGTGTSNTSGLIPGANITIIGNVISAAVPPPSPGVSLEVNGTPNSSQTVLNLKSSDASVTITDQGAGNVNFQVPAAPAIPDVFSYLGNLHYYSSISQSGGALNSIGMTITTPSSSVLAPTATEGPLTLTQLALGSQWQEGDNCITPGTLNTFMVRCSTAIIANCHNWWGMVPHSQFSNFLSLSTPFIPNCPVIAFRYAADQDGIGGNIQCYCSTDSTNFTVVNTGIAASTSTSIHIYQIITTGAGTVANFYIDGTKVATISTNVPSLGSNLSVLLSSIDITESAANQQWAVSRLGWQLNN